MKWPLRILLILIALIGLSVFVLILFSGGSATFPPLPSPNGYDDLVKAGEMVSERLDDYSKASAEELRAYVTRNAEALARLRIGLSRDCRVPLDLDMTNTYVELPAMRRVVWLLVAEGRLAELEGRPADAVQSYLDAIHVGNNSSRGGFLIHRLVGVACEVNGFVPLAKLAPGFSTETQRAIIAALERVDANSVTWDEVWEAEKACIRHQLRKEKNPITWVKGFLEAWWARKGTLDQHNKIAAHIRLLATQLALQCYRSREGRIPLRLEELVPQYLQRDPNDPFNGRALIYRAQGTNWVLYSVGPDQVDDGGKSAGPTRYVPLPGVKPPKTKGDLFFDSPW